MQPESIAAYGGSGDCRTAEDREWIRQSAQGDCDHAVSLKIPSIARELYSIHDLKSYIFRETSIFAPLDLGGDLAIGIPSLRSGLRKKFLRILCSCNIAYSVALFTTAARARLRSYSLVMDSAALT